MMRTSGERLLGICGSMTAYNAKRLPKSNPDIAPTILIIAGPVHAETVVTVTERLYARVWDFGTGLASFDR